MPNATEIKFGDPTTRLAQTDRWTVLLRPKQPTLGSLVLICREPVRAFADVSVEGYIELRDLVRRIEAMLQTVVAYERINYLMLMMVDPDVHFHVLPRYAATRACAGQDFTDVAWPGPPRLNEINATDDATNDIIRASLRSHWPSHGA